MNLYKKIVICLIIILLAIISTSHKVYGRGEAIKPDDLLGTTDIKGYVGKEIYNDSWPYDACTQHYGVGWSTIITGIYRTYYNSSTKRIEMNSATSNKYVYGAYGTDVSRLAKAMSLPNNLGGVWYELRSVVNSNITKSRVLTLAPSGDNDPGIDTTWRNSYTNDIKLYQNYHGIEINDSKAKAQEKTYDGDAYIVYGPVTIRFGGANITSKTAKTDTGTTIKTIYYSKNAKEWADNSINASTKATEGKYRYGQEGVSTYIWIKKSDIDITKDKKITITYKQANFSSFADGVAITCDEGNVGQANLRYAYKSNTIKGASATLTINLDYDFGSIKIKKVNKNATNKKVNMEFKIYCPTNKKYVGDSTSKGYWKWVDTLSAAHTFSTTKGEATVDNLYKKIFGTTYKYHIYETKIKTEGFTLENQTGYNKNLGCVVLTTKGIVPALGKDLEDKTLKNVPDPETREFTVTKKWEGNWTKPEGWYISVTLKNNSGTVVGTATLNSGHTSHTFEELPKYKTGTTKEITYHAEYEEHNMGNWTPVITKETKDTLEITNSYNSPQETQYTVRKIWAGDVSSIPQGWNISVTLKNDSGTVVGTATLNSSHSSHTFSNLPKYKPGTNVEITYHAEYEEHNIGNTWTSSVTKNTKNLLEITNTPEDEPPSTKPIEIRKIGGDMSFKIYANSINPVYETYEYSKELDEIVRIPADSTTYDDKVTGEATTSPNYDYIHYDYEITEENSYEYWYTDVTYGEWSDYTKSATTPTNTNNAPTTTSYNSSIGARVTQFNTDDTQYQYYTVFKKDAQGNNTTEVDHYMVRTRTITRTDIYDYYNYLHLTNYTHRWNDIRGGEVTGEKQVSYEDAETLDDDKLLYESHTGWYYGGRYTVETKDEAPEYETHDGIETLDLPAGSYTIYEVDSDEYYDLELQPNYDETEEYRTCDSISVAQNSSWGILSEYTDSSSKYTVNVVNNQTRGNLKVIKKLQFSEDGEAEDMNFAIYCSGTTNGNYTGWLTGETQYQGIDWDNIGSIYSGSPTSNTYQLSDGEFSITGLPLGTYDIYEVSSNKQYYDLELQDNYDEENNRVYLGSVTVIAEGTTSFTEKEVYNTPTRGGLNIKKVGTANSEKEDLSDVTVKIKLTTLANGKTVNKYLNGEYDYIELNYEEFLNSLDDTGAEYEFSGDNIEISGLPIGNYEIEEIANNNSYYDFIRQENYDSNSNTIDLGTYTVVATEDHNGEEKELSNNSTRGNLEIQKNLATGANLGDQPIEIMIYVKESDKEYWLGASGDDGEYDYSEFEYDSIPKERAVFVTNSQGKIKLECVPIGTYTIYEKKTYSIEYALESQGEYSSGEQLTLLGSVTVDPSLESIVTWNNFEKTQIRRKTGNIEIEKKGHYANDGVEVNEPLANVSFIIKSNAVDIGGWKTSEQQYVYYRLNEAGEEIVDFTDDIGDAHVFTTDENGSALATGLYTDLGPYTVEEVDSPNIDKYYSDIIIVQGDMENKYVWSEQTTNVDVIDQRTSGDLKIIKQDSVYREEDSTKETLNLAGAKYKVKLISAQYLDVQNMWLRENPDPNDESYYYIDESGERERVDFYMAYYKKEGNTYSFYDSKHEHYLIDDVNKAAVFETDANGELNIKKIINGTYEIWEVEAPEGYSLEKQTGYDKDLKMAKVGTVEIKTENNNTVRTVLDNQKVVVKLDGHVWKDDPRAKVNDYNEIQDDNEKLISGITVELYDKQKQKVIARTPTDGNGHYEFTHKNVEGFETVNDQNKYNSPETDPRLNYWELANCYVRFIYDNKGNHDDNGFIQGDNYGYVTVDPLVGNDKTKNSKAQEYDMPREKLEEMNLTGTLPDYPGIAITKPGTDNTDSYVEFRDYKEIKSYEDKEVRDKLLPGYYDNASYTINDINLGLKDKLQPDFTVSEEIAYMKVQFGNYVYKYEYMSENEHISKMVPTVNEQNSLRTFTGQIYPSDIAYNMESGNDELKVYVVYRIAVQNNVANSDLTEEQEEKGYTSNNTPNNYVEEKMYLSSLINTYESDRYQLSNAYTEGIDTPEVERDNALWTVEGTETARYNVNDSRNPYYSGLSPLETKTSYIQFQVTEPAVEQILTKNLDTEYLRTAPSVTTAKTYHDFWRKDNLWNQKQGEEKRYQNYTQNKQINGYTKTDYLHKSWEQTKTTSELNMKFELPEKERTLTGTVFEDKSIDDETKLGNGINEVGENTVSTVVVELVDIKNAETPVKLYPYDTNENNNYKVDIAYRKVPVGGKFSFEGVIPGYYFVRYTYGDGTVRYTDLDGNVKAEPLATQIDDADSTQVKTNDYKSTIISGDISEVIKDALSKDASTSDEVDDRNKGQWYKEFTKNYSTAIDDIDERKNISGDNVTYEVDKDINLGLMHAFTPRTYITIEDDEDDNKESSQVDVNVTNPDGTLGLIPHYEEFEEFNFGIIKVPATVVKLDKKIINVEFTNSQGSSLVSANPEGSRSIYLTDLDGMDNNGGSKYAKVELDPNLIDNSRIKVTYEVTITNDSDISFTEKEYFMFGTGGVTPETVKVLVRDYLDGKFDYGNIDKIYNRVERRREGGVALNPETEFVDMSGWTAIQKGESETIRYTAYDTLQTAIEDLNFGNTSGVYKITLGELNTLRTNIDRSIKEVSPWDRSNIEDQTTLVITPSTGIDRSNTNYIAITIALIVVAGVLIIIKKKAF